MDIDSSSFDKQVSSPHFARIADIRNMTQERCSLLLLLNPEVFPKECIDSQSPETLIIANNYHSTARRIMDNE